MKISVIIPVRDGERFLREAVESLRAQRVPIFETIVVDDGSTDGTVDVISRLGHDVRAFYQPNRGPAAARNLGLRHARGEVIGFLDADDLWPADKLERQLPPLLDDALCDAVLGNVEKFRVRRDPDGTGRIERTIPHFIFVVGCGLYRRSVFDAIGDFDSSMRHSEDSDWLNRFREAGRHAVILRETTLLYRQHEANMTRRAGEKDSGYLHALKRSLDRRRSEGGGRVRDLPRLLDVPGNFPGRDAIDLEALRGRR